MNTASIRKVVVARITAIKARPREWLITVAKGTYGQTLPKVKVESIGTNSAGQTSSIGKHKP
jgi:hypothetical protein